MAMETSHTVIWATTMVVVGTTTMATRWAQTTGEEVDILRTISIKDTASSSTISSHMINRDARVSRIINNNHMVESTKDIIRITTMRMVDSTINMSIKMGQRSTVQPLNMAM